jgi:hypothetical protein
MNKVILFALAGLTGGAVVGCYSTLDSFDKRMAKLGCINVRECQPEAFAAEYDSLGECTDDVKAELDTAFAGCSYDAARGRSCIHAIYRMRKDCGLFDMTSVSECSGTLTCTVHAPDDGSLRRQILDGFVAPGVGGPDSVPLDEAVELDGDLDDALEALE